MDRIWQWAWDRYGPRYSWVIGAAALPMMVPSCLLWPLVVVAFEKSSHYVEAVALYSCSCCGDGVLLGASRLGAVSAWSSGGLPARCGSEKRTGCHLRLDTGGSGASYGRWSSLDRLADGQRGCDRGGKPVAPVPVRSLGRLAGLGTHMFGFARLRGSNAHVRQGSRSSVTPESVTLCLALARLSPHGRTRPWWRECSCSPSRVRCSRPWSVRPVETSSVPGLSP